MNQYQLKLSDGSTPTWDGETGEDACRRYADCCGHRHAPGTQIVAWRTWPRTGVFVGNADRIVEGGAR